MPRTGNHSLAKALEILGYSAKRFPESDDEISNYDFLCDFPIISEFKDLDKHYPNSKFIMMTRDDDSWLTSATAHYKKYPVDSRRPSRRKYRLEFFGTVEPNKEDLLRAKHQHEESVKQYFNNRSEDILYINIIGGDGWEKLCPFLDKPEPDTLFPELNVTTP